MRRLTVLAASLVVALAAVLASASSQAATQGRWVIRDLGTLGEHESVAAGLNDRGQIVGWAGWDWYEPRAAIWQGGRGRALGGLGGKYSSAMAINERGQVVGWAETRTVKKNRHAFLWQNGKMRDLGTLGGKESDAASINDRSQVVGSALTKTKDEYGDPISHAFLWQNGKMTDLGTLGGKSSYAEAISPHGQVVGWSSGYGHRMHWDSTGPDAEPFGNANPFLWENGTLRALVSSRNASRVAGTAALAINDRDQIVGSSVYRLITRALLWEKGKVRDLGTLGGESSSASDINDRGQIVGWSKTKPTGRSKHGRKHAFVWQDGKMTDLGTLPGGTRSAALGINERGQIVGWSETRRSIVQDGINGQHAVLWTYKP